MSTQTYIPASPATPYQLYLVGLGHELTRCQVDGSWHLRASVDRVEVTPCGVAHIPYADELAAERFAKTFEANHPAVDQPQSDRIELVRQQLAVDHNLTDAERQAYLDTARDAEWSAFMGDRT